MSASDVKYKYRVIPASKNIYELERKLNNMGESGWKAVFVVFENGSYYALCMKEEKSDGRDHYV